MKEVQKEGPSVPLAVPAKIVLGYKEPKAGRFDQINMIITHKEFGDIPYTLCPKDGSEIAKEVVELLAADGVVFKDLEKCPSIEVMSALDERMWRNDELKKADVIINKIEDFEIEGDSKAWRKYRVALRNWPDHDKFPSKRSRPKAPKLAE